MEAEVVEAAMVTLELEVAVEVASVVMDIITVEDITRDAGGASGEGLITIIIIIFPTIIE